jgi:hypothetical protein
VLCQGFGFRDPDNVAKHHQTLAQLFRLADPIREEVASFESEWIPAGGPTVVGFHIRRGDYGSYAGGEFFLDDAHWIDLIRQARDVVRGEGGWFHGILFSNEDIDHIVDSAEDLVRGPGGLFTDLEMLSRCDRIIAPPSTYSGWASFIGRVPLLRVDKSSVALDSSRWEIVAW